MPVLTRRACLLALLGGGAALAGCSPWSAAPGPTRPQPAAPTHRPSPTATATPRRVAPPTAAARAASLSPLAPDPVLRSRRLLYVGTHAGHRGLIVANGDGSGAGLIIAGTFVAPTWAPNGGRFVAIGALPGEERLAPQAWVYLDGPTLLQQFRLEGLDKRAHWAPDSQRLALLAQRSDAASTGTQATATHVIAGARVIEIAIAQQAWPLGWTADGRLVVSSTSGALDESPTERPRSLWTTSVAGDDRRQVASGDYEYVGIEPSAGHVYALGHHQPYPSRSGPTIGKPTRLSLIDLRDGQTRWQLAATEIARAGLSGAAAATPYWLVGAAVSPRGDRVAVWLQPDPSRAWANPALAVVDSLAQVRWVEEVPGAEALLPPIWSPWGERLAFGVGPEHTRLRLRLSASESHEITTTNVEEARWSPDGAWIAYTQGPRLLVCDAGDPTRTYVIAEDGHTPRWQSK